MRIHLSSKLGRIAFAKSIAGCKFDREVNAEALNKVSKLRDTTELDSDGAVINKYAESGTITSERSRLSSMAEPIRIWPFQKHATIQL
jgi:hypothetical protein